MIKDKQQFEPFTDTPITLLSEAGEWLAPFELELSDAKLQKIYRDLLAARLLDERFVRLQRMGKSSFVAPFSGHEGAQVGAAHAVTAGKDWLFPYYRDYAMALAIGVPPLEIFAQVMGSPLDPARARQMPMHPGSRDLNLFTPVSAIAAHIPPAVGAALSMKLQGTDEVSLASFGDGATSEGDWHAGLNFAGAQGAPVVFVCENNRYAISVEYHKQTGAETIAAKAHAYGMPGYFVDGMDVLACYFVIKEAVEQARAGLGPSLIETLVYRFGPHSSADDDSHYRSGEEKELWQGRDPLLRMQKFLASRGLWSKDEDEAMRDEINAGYSAVIKEVEAAGKAPLEWMFEDVYAEMPEHLKVQKELL